jgi:putative transposase
MELAKRKITYRLYPTSLQAAILFVILRLHQQFYNAALEQRILVYGRRKLTLGFSEQCKEATLVRAEFPEYASLNAQSLQVTLKRLDLAFQSFFRRVKSGVKSVGFPRFKSLERFSGWGYKTHGDGWRLFAGEGMKHGSLRLSEVGHIKMRGKARTMGTPNTLEILYKQGCWYASVTIECQPQRISGKGAIGIDWGLETFATIANTDGIYSEISNPRFVKKSLKSLKTKQRKLSKKKRKSQNRKTARKKVAKLHAKISNRRKDFLHQTTARLVKASGLIGTEELNVKGMSAHGGAHKKGLNREILSAAPGAFHQMLKYKAEEAGVEFVEIDTRKAKPSQTCHGCERYEKKDLSERRHVCPCGVTCTRDENAATVILNWALFGNAKGREPACCGGEALVSPMKQETLAIAA